MPTNAQIAAWKRLENLRTITVDQYQQYLRTEFKETSQYLQYTGGSETQVKNFQGRNPGYYAYDDMINTHDDDEHPWNRWFDEDTCQDDADAASEAISQTATRQIRVFGGIEYQQQGQFLVQE
ncbi:Hypothetical protein D9617_8g048800 [Elsinoe fawcettii]|nr:Hypothetical protein D9617_8g048800 [Elsinoe fawcettii]